ncbi:hypothetical protein QQF64_021167 [Cirrhinus molitorella]|uniref:Calmodulin binding transcription activator 1 n=1 Tax=Cirrhinus molitorella TaxID=172907 RepID=A0ABR3LBB6_9TELE
MAAENKPEDEHGHLKIYLPKKLLECLPKCSTLPKERHRWNTNESVVRRGSLRAEAAGRLKLNIVSLP